LISPPVIVNALEYYTKTHSKSIVEKDRGVCREKIGWDWKKFKMNLTGADICAG
jgi:hypothetical protein